MARNLTCLDSLGHFAAHPYTDLLRWHPCKNRTLRHIMGYNAVRADNRTIANRDALENTTSPAYPDIAPDSNLPGDVLLDANRHFY